MGTSLSSTVERLVAGRWVFVGTATYDAHGRVTLSEALEVPTRALVEILTGVTMVLEWEVDGLPIVPLRGVPTDASPEVRTWKSQTDPVDHHAHSWVTVAELDAFDWDRTATYTTEVSAAQYAVWTKTGGRPPEIRGHRHFGARRHVAPAQMDAWLAAATRLGWAPPEPAPFVADVDAAALPAGVPHELADALCGATTYVSWDEPFAAAVGEFLRETMPRLRTLGPPEDVRIVFHCG